MHSKILAVLLFCLLGLCAFLVLRTRPIRNVAAPRIADLPGAQTDLPSHEGIQELLDQSGHEADNRQQERILDRLLETLPVPAVPSNEGKASDPQGPDNSSGVSDADRLDFLVNSHNLMLATCTSVGSTEEQCLQAKIAFARRCVATILHYRGRSLSPTDLESVGDLSPDEFRFSADLAWYSFYRGEFPVFDSLHDSIADEDSGVVAVASSDNKNDEQLEALYQEALSSCPDSQRQPGRKPK